MRLVSFGPTAAERPGILSEDGEWITPLAALDVTLPNTIRGVLQENCLSKIQKLFKQQTSTLSEQKIKSSTVRLGSPITDPGKIICVGLNYRGHAQEQNKAWPEQPMLFSKPTTSLCGAHDTIFLPTEDCGPDYEVELVVVIGVGGKQIAAESAYNHIAGYCIGNDISGRRWQKSDVQYFRAKGCDTFFPCGPFMLTHDEVNDPTTLRLTTTINNQILQDATVADLIHDIPTLISYISRYMTLQPGDLISTGTPAGVGCYRKPPRFLIPGDVVQCRISGSCDLGILANPVAAAP